MEDFFREVGANINLCTYPTISSILPDLLINSQPVVEPNDESAAKLRKVQEAMQELDATLSTSTKGAYVIVTGQK